MGRQGQQALGLRGGDAAAAVVPNVIPAMLPSVLVFCQISFSTLPPSVLVRWAGNGSFGGDAADCGST